MTVSGLLQKAGQITATVVLWSLFFLPPLIFVPGRWKGQWIFVNYREPKLAAIQILSWGTISIFFLFLFGDLKSTFWSLRREKLLWLLAILTIYTLLSASWALVPEAAFYEGLQWFTLTCLFWVLTTLFTIRRWRHLALFGLWISFGVVTFIGLLQTQMSIPWLIPISKSYPWTSTFGAKNTCFLSLLGQYFLLPYAIYTGFKDRNWAWVLAGAILLVLETGYMFISQSRTTYAGLLVGFLTLGIAAGHIYGLPRAIWKWALAGVLILGLGIGWSLKNQATNYIYNGGIEIGSEHSNLPEGWTVYDSVPHGKQRNSNPGLWTKEEAHSGDFSLMVSNQTGSRVGWKGKEISFSQPYPQALTLGGWSKALDVGGSKGRYALLFKITFDDETYTWFMPGPLRFTSGTHEWELRETSHVWNRDITTVQPYVILYDCTGTVWFDDMFVRTVPRLLAKITHFWEIKVKPYLLHPGHFFTQTARGTAAWDTLSMVKEHPWGVGAGNWGFAYPLYHKHMIKRSFSENTQIRRAHNDYIEYLGELGWPGLVILLGLVFIPLIRITSKMHLLPEKEKMLAICLVGQLMSCCIMLALDYFLEYPYRKFLFVVLLALATSLSYQCSDRLKEGTLSSRKT